MYHGEIFQGDSLSKCHVDLAQLILPFCHGFIGMLFVQGKLHFSVYLPSLLDGIVYVNSLKLGSQSTHFSRKTAIIRFMFIRVEAA